MLTSDLRQSEFEVEAQGEEFSPFKARAFHRAIKTIDELPGPIESGLQAQKVCILLHSPDLHMEGLTPRKLDTKHWNRDRTKNRGLLESCRIGETITILCWPILVLTFT